MLAVSHWFKSLFRSLGCKDCLAVGCQVPVPTMNVVQAEMDVSAQMAPCSVQCRTEVGRKKVFLTGGN